MYYETGLSREALLLLSCMDIVLLLVFGPSLTWESTKKTRVVSSALEAVAVVDCRHWHMARWTEQDLALESWRNS